MLFQTDLERMGMKPPEHWAKASEHIPEQIALIEQLEARGFTYQSSDAVYFDTSRAPHYGELSGLRASGQHSRVLGEARKRNAADFALWKLSPASGPRRQLEWPSPWGIGFPGWHIAGISPQPYRYYLMTAHYRAPLDLSLEGLHAASTAFSRLSAFVLRDAASQVEAQGNEGTEWRDLFFAALYHDLDAPRALSVLWSIFADASLTQPTRAGLIAELGGTLGLEWQTRATDAPTLTPELAALVEQREQARAARDFARADALRAELLTHGIDVQDAAQGSVARKATRAANPTPEREAANDKDARAHVVR